MRIYNSGFAQCQFRRPFFTSDTFNNSVEQAVVSSTCSKVWFEVAANRGVDLGLNLQRWVTIWASQLALVVKNLPASAGDIRDVDSTPESGRSPGGEHGNPLWYSCLENPINRGAWRATVHRVTKSWTGLQRLNTHAQVTIQRDQRFWWKCLVSLTIPLERRGTQGRGGSTSVHQGPEKNKWTARATAFTGVPVEKGKAGLGKQLGTGWFEWLWWALGHQGFP